MSETVAPDAEEAASGFRKPKAGPHVCNSLCPIDCLVLRLKQHLESLRHVLGFIVENVGIIQKDTLKEMTQDCLKLLMDSGVMTEEQRTETHVILQRRDAKQVWLFQRNLQGFGLQWSVWEDQSDALNAAKDGDEVFQAGLVSIGKMRRTLTPA
jgi:hypothetical protein